MSWPNLTKALGRAADPKRWAVLYLGPAKLAAEDQARPIVALDRAGQPAKDQAAALAELDGLILLDGSWSQAKALWWRNAWLLKTRRLVLNTGRPSRYGRLRKEPRADSVSTIEAAAFALARLENRPEIEQRLTQKFEEMLRQYRVARTKTHAGPGEDGTNGTTQST